MDSMTTRSKGLTVVVKRGLQVVGCASLDEETGRLSDVVVRPSARSDSHVGQSLIDAVKNHARHSRKFDKIIVEPSNTSEGVAFFEKMGFELIAGNLYAICSF
jgi:ribosomal protein S18 acetylase RimI-like enzyme